VALITYFQIQGEITIYCPTPIKVNEHVVVVIPYGGWETKKIRLGQRSLLQSYQHYMPVNLYGSWEVDGKFTLSLKSCCSN
jgi:hypothetical protein